MKADVLQNYNKITKDATFLHKGMDPEEQGKALKRFSLLEETNIIYGNSTSVLKDDINSNKHMSFSGK